MKINYNDKKELENESLNTSIKKDNGLKQSIVEYVGNKLTPKDDKVTTEMVIEVMAQDFPEIILALAEENFIRGYSQALTDVQLGEKLKNEEIHKESTE